MGAVVGSAAAAASAAPSTDAAASPKLVYGLFSETCWSLLSGGDALNGTCWKMALSKALGYAIISGAFVVKVPQIINIVRANSAMGLVVGSGECG